ncbi:l-seryl-trna [Cystoisospora suis]|uniref:L-seryl-trna n=1 Tax=Cystoisospora suis TaxID=483139 RepID=A0A2C6L8U6_9APIC|nr:l-seryl-trna [Cystoisospora suis]
MGDPAPRTRTHMERGTCYQGGSMGGQSCTNCMLFLVYGLPASGKTSLCRQLCSSGDFAEAVGITHSECVNGPDGRESSRTLDSYPCRQVHIHHVCFDAIERKLYDKFLTQESVQRVTSLLAGQCEKEVFGWPPHQSGHRTRDQLLSLLLGPQAIATTCTPSLHAELSSPTATSQLTVEAREKRRPSAQTTDSWRANVDNKREEGDHDFSPTIPQAAASVRGAPVSTKPRQGDEAPRGGKQDAKTTREAGQRILVPTQGGQFLQAHVVEDPSRFLGAHTEEDKPLSLPCTAQNTEVPQICTSEYQTTKYGFPPVCDGTDKRSTSAVVGPDRKILHFNRAIWRLARRLAAARVESLVEAAFRSERAPEMPEGETRVQCTGRKDEYEGEHVVAESQKNGKPDDREECGGGTHELDQVTNGLPHCSRLLGERHVHKGDPARCIYRRSGQDGRESSIAVPKAVGSVKRVDAGQGRSCTGRESRREYGREEGLCGDRPSDGYGHASFASSSPWAPVCSLKGPRQGSTRLRPSPSLNTSSFCLRRRSASSPPYFSLSFSPPRAPALNTSSATARLLSRDVFSAPPPPCGLHVILVDDTMHLGSMRKEYFRLATKWNCAFHQVFLDTPLDECMRRNRLRQSTYPTRLSSSHLRERVDLSSAPHSRPPVSSQGEPQGRSGVGEEGSALRGTRSCVGGLTSGDSRRGLRDDAATEEKPKCVDRKSASEHESSPATEKDRGGAFEKKHMRETASIAEAYSPESEENLGVPDMSLQAPVQVPQQILLRHHAMFRLRHEKRATKQNHSQRSPGREQETGEHWKVTPDGDEGESEKGELQKRGDTTKKENHTGTEFAGMPPDRPDNAGIPGDPGAETASLFREKHGGSFPEFHPFSRTVSADLSSVVRASHHSGNGSTFPFIPGTCECPPSCHYHSQQQSSPLSASQRCPCCAYYPRVPTSPLPQRVAPTSVAFYSSPLSAAEPTPSLSSVQPTCRMVADALIASSQCQSMAEARKEGRDNLSSELLLKKKWEARWPACHSWTLRMRQQPNDRIEFATIEDCEAEIVRALIRCGSAVWTPADDSEAPAANMDASTVEVGEADKKINTRRKEALDELETTLRRLVTAALNSIPSESQNWKTVLAKRWSARKAACLEEYRRRAAESSGFTNRRKDSLEGQEKDSATPVASPLPTRDSRRDTEQPLPLKSEPDSGNSNLTLPEQQGGYREKWKKTIARRRSEVTTQAIVEASGRCSAVTPTGKVHTLDREKKGGHKKSKKTRKEKASRNKNRRGIEKEKTDDSDDFFQDLHGFADYLADSFFRACMSDCSKVGDVETQERALAKSVNDLSPTVGVLVVKPQSFRESHEREP